jgi:eukaryotic-like serine/threonine-protein kinase
MNSSPLVPKVVGRYALFGEIAFGGMATVHVGRLLGEVGFERTVVIKRLHAHLAKDATFVAMFMDEARLAARIRHPNVVSIIDVVTADNELLLVMEYVQGESLSRLMSASREVGLKPDLRIVVKIISEVLCGLHAAHEATDEKGSPLRIVHRDVSPQNVLVGVDGVARVIDFGVAKAVGRLQTTRDGSAKGKVAYMAPEQIEGGSVDRRTDVYAASVVLWEALTGERLFKRADAALMFEVLEGKIVAPSLVGSGTPKLLDDVVMRGLSRDPANRYPTALDMAEALSERVGPASAREAGAWVECMAPLALAKRAEQVSSIESNSNVSAVRLKVSEFVSQSVRASSPSVHPPVAASGATTSIRPLVSVHPAGEKDTALPVQPQPLEVVPTLPVVVVRSPRPWSWALLGAAVSAIAVALGWMLLGPRTPSRASDPAAAQSASPASLAVSSQPPVSESSPTVSGSSATAVESAAARASPSSSSPATTGRAKAGGTLGKSRAESGVGGSTPGTQAQPGAKDPRDYGF